MTGSLSSGSLRRSAVVKPVRRRRRRCRKIARCFGGVSTASNIDGRRWALGAGPMAPCFVWRAFPNSPGMNPRRPGIDPGKDACCSAAIGVVHESRRASLRASERPTVPTPTFHNKASFLSFPFSRPSIFGRGSLPPPPQASTKLPRRKEFSPHLQPLRHAAPCLRASLHARCCWPSSNASDPWEGKTIEKWACRRCHEHLQRFSSARSLFLPSSRSIEW
jgi:hypothetical protein